MNSSTLNLTTPSMPRSQKTVVIGLGLIGGSLALDLKLKGFSLRVVGVDQNPEHERLAVERELVERVEPFETAVQDADLVVLAIPVNAIVKILPRVLQLIPENAVVTDMGSVKELICNSVSAHPRRSSFVASHPMAGTENSGPNAAFSGLFNERIAVICDQGESAPAAVEKIEDMYRTIKSKLVYMTAADHDLHVAYVSHLSHVISFVLANTVLGKEKNHNTIFNLSGGSFESTVRLAKSSPEMWAPIFLDNRFHVGGAIARYIDQLQVFREALEQNKVNEILNFMREANRIRSIFPSRTVRGDPESQSIEGLRRQIDDLDQKILETLAQRMQAAEEIGHLKGKIGSDVLQQDRWEEVLKSRMEKARALGIRDALSKPLLELIHAESLRLQTEVVTQVKKKERE